MSDGRKTVLLIAGEASGDTLGAELIKAMRAEPGGDEIDFIGAGGPQMEAAALRPEFDLSEHAVVGIWEVLKNYFKFRRLFRHLLELATRREPDIIVLIDYPDRKSTRLNSSHKPISYAVFCLKKKNTYHTHHPQSFLPHLAKHHHSHLPTP